MLAVLLYESDPVGYARAREVYPRHRENYLKFLADGSIVMLGPFSDGLGQGAMSVLRSVADAERFVASDPFVLEGVVKSYEIREWNAVGPPEGAPIT